jgi:hypothetical protein
MRDLIAEEIKAIAAPSDLIERIEATLAAFDRNFRKPKP